ncbi:hypothetical protein ACH42_06230 [Endozoicomonas sp. (ex Bugula neritina AB1)]|nr:hypothetical protein ACH42_06230 [Endozoicomonas sp. (ex Bugula neritina AB1)]
MFDTLSNLHFLYPQWLWGLIPCFVSGWLLYGRNADRHGWREIIAPHLFHHLKQKSGSSLLLRPAIVMMTILVVALLALAGPSIQREVPEAVDNQSATIILLDNSLSMYSGDISPTRYERARQKIYRFQSLRPGAKNALITYSGSAHTITPLTDDPYFFNLYLDAIEPAMMPAEGMNLAAALEKAESLLPGTKEPVSLLIITDSLKESDINRLVDFRERYKLPVLTLAVGTAKGGDLNLPEEMKLGHTVDTRLPVDEFVSLRNSGIDVIGITSDDEDMQWLDHRMNQTSQRVHNSNSDFQWQNNGLWLVWCLIPLTLLWFRKGWTLFSLLLASSLSLSIVPTTAKADVIDWWLTPDQQGQLAFNYEQYVEAASKFQDLYWQGLSYYRAGLYAQASSAFGQLARNAGASGSVLNMTERMAKASFYEANSLSQMKEWEKALTAYDRALSLNPVFPEAKKNRDAVVYIVKQLEQERQSRNEQQQADAHFTPDDIRINKSQEEGVQVEINENETSISSDSWLKGLQATPLGLMTRRFYREYMEETAADNENTQNLKNREPGKEPSH